MKLELHCHTTASDGSLSPAQLVDLAVERGITTLAITDHDSFGGFAEASAAAKGRLELISGIEFGCLMPFGEVHMLAYLFDPDNEALIGKLDWLRSERKLRGQRMVERLQAQGIDLSWERVRQIAGDGSVGRPHVAEALIEAGLAKDVDDAFSRYIGYGRPAYVPRVALKPLEVIALVREAGGVVSIAHPANIPEPESVLAPLVEGGLAGLECYYGEYQPETVARLVALADSLDLVPTGGSDFHGRPIKDHATLGGSPTVPPDTVDRLRERQPKV